MLKVMIVDDEVFVRIGIRSSIDWEKNGFEVVAEAADGCQALELCRRHRPDILMTDIKMPKMDGIELIRQLKKEQPDCKVIVLSCLEEFHYLREAMRLGIEDYLLKVGLMPDHMLQVLNAMKTKYWGEVKAEGNESADRMQALESIIMGYADSDGEVQQLIRQYNLELPLQRYYILRIRVDQGTAGEHYHENTILFKTLLGLLQDAIAQQFCGEVVQCGSDAFAALVYPRAAVSEQQAGKAVASLGNLVICTILQALGLKVSIGISNPHHGAEHLVQAEKEAREALNMRFFSQNGDHVFFASHMQGTLTQAQQQDYPRMNKGVQIICDALTCGDKESIVRAVEEVKAELREKRMDEGYARLYFTKVYLAVLELLESVDQPLDNAKQKYAGLENIVLYGNSLEGIAARVQELALEAADCYAEFKRRKKSNVVMQVLDYVDQNYAENISLSLISQKFNINSAYFCKLFKQVTGKTFVEHLTQRRIAAAQKLLRETDMRSYMIAQEVGFMNVEYFSKVFHNHVSMSPKEYRNHCRHAQDGNL